MEEIKIKQIDALDTIKVKCQACNGTGIHTRDDEFGIVCKYCLGTGYKDYKLNGTSVFKDYGNGVYYLVKDNVIEDSIDVFESLTLRSDISYVILDGSLPLLYEYMLLENTDNMLVPYSDFIKGSLPLPVESITCPALLTEVYKSKRKFENDCPVNKYHTCNLYYNAEECWNMFYDGKQSVEEKQSILRRKLK